ncbi:hypothetical protein CEXT_93771 [Caerostris extrusa]|uniref:Uncharacterized protein n=1 Tax=Caerostris extrusa TaxID=172846 RepID=A0AAV4YFD3_CAEEX|nr:hypothetical protein CEXT_93771 [Caerostris extrusa]
MLTPQKSKHHPFCRPSFVRLHHDEWEGKVESFWRSFGALEIPYSNPTTRQVGSQLDRRQLEARSSTGRKSRFRLVFYSVPRAENRLVFTSIFRTLPFFLPLFCRSDACGKPSPDRRIFRRLFLR